MVPATFPNTLPHPILTPAPLILPSLAGESILRQVAEEPAGVLALFALLISASLVPACLGAKKEAFGPFTPNAELMNSRASMIGFAAMLAIEANIGHALF